MVHHCLDQYAESLGFGTVMLATSMIYKQFVFFKVIVVLPCFTPLSILYVLSPIRGQIKHIILSYLILTYFILSYHESS